MITNALSNPCVFGIPGTLTPELAPREMSSPNCKAQELCWKRMSALYQMLQEIKWENLFHLNLQIIANSLGSSTHTARASGWLASLGAGWVLCSSSATSAGSKVWGAELKSPADNFQGSLGSSLQPVPSYTLWLPWPLHRCENGTWEACVQSW